ncbi:MAG: hypothetical protein PHW47_05390 [Lachnospira sp.]|nr:hypothetical protein [Lachnospira sp.]
MKLKKFAAVAASVLTIVSFCIPVYAVDLNDAEKSIITTLESSSVPSTYVNQARNYFLLDSVDVTANQASTINSQISAAKVHAGTASDLSQLTAEQQTQITQDLAAAGNVLGLTVTYNAANKSLTVANGSNIVFEAVNGSITTAVTTPSTNNSNGNGSTGSNNAGSTGTTSSNGIIKQTGINMNTSIMIIIGLAAIVCLSGVIVYKKNFNKKEV